MASSSIPPRAARSRPFYDVYISHAGPDMSTIATPLYEELWKRSIKALLDLEELLPGQEAASVIQKALETARIGVFILSVDFVARRWPVKELYCFMERLGRAEAQHRDKPLLIPIFYRLDVKQCYDIGGLIHSFQDGKNPFIEGRFIERLSQGEPEANLEKLQSAFGKLTSHMGIENNVGATNEDSAEMQDRRRELINNSANSIERAVNVLDEKEVADPRIVAAALSEGTDKLDTVRLMVLGGSTRGKTSTLASLQRKPFDETRESTRGADLSIYHLILGREFGDEDDILTLAEKDKFQTKFMSYLLRRSLLDTTTEPFDNGADIPGKTNVESDEVTEELRKTKQQSADRPNESVMQLAGDAINSSSFPDGEVKGITLRCWDFGGQREYEVAHELFISPRSILMLVFDLSRFENESTQDDEVRELSHWLQALFAATADEDLPSTATSLLIVGTRMDSCKRPEMLPEYFELLKGKLADILDTGVTKSLALLNVKVLAIENSNAISDSQSSGLQALEGHLDVLAKRIIEESEPVPLRWLAFLESLRADDNDERGIYLHPRKIISRMDGFYFPPSDVDRKADLRALLLFFRDLGELVLFDKSRLELTAAGEKYVVFLEPEKILRALKVIVAPERVRCEGLAGREDRKRMRDGILTKEMLRMKWENLEGLGREQDRAMLVELLASMDLFVKLEDNLVGVPALLKSGWDGWGWMSDGEDKKEVAAMTRFENYVPFGLIGTVVSRLHRTIGCEQTKVRYVRSNAILLTTGLGDNDAARIQVFMGFDRSRLELHWIVRGQTHGFRMLGRCLSIFEAHMRERINDKVCRYEHFFVTDCPRGCSEVKFRLMFPMPPIHGSADPSTECTGGWQWWNTDDLDVASVSKKCKPAECMNENCCNYYSYAQAMNVSEPSSEPELIRKGVPDQYVAFVSHAGPDKMWAEQMAEVLERRGLRAFVDRRELKCSSETGDELMNQAMQAAHIGIFILSPEFFAREYTMLELKTFLSRKEMERSGSSSSDKQVVIYPIFHRLSYTEAKDRALDKNAKYRAIFEQEGLFDESRQQGSFSITAGLECMKRLSRYPGLEKKLPEMHSFFMQRDPGPYRVRYMHRTIRNAVNAVWRYEDADGDLGGLTLQQFFEFAADRVASQERQTRTSSSVMDQ